jgi:hypothetical protein
MSLLHAFCISIVITSFFASLSSSVVTVALAIGFTLLKKKNRIQIQLLLVDVVSWWAR